MSRITNNTGQSIPNLISMMHRFLIFAKNRMNFDKPVDIELMSNLKNGKILLGKTAYYDPNNYRIHIFIDNRHPKDILRSLSHELMHHTQNCRGDLGNTSHFEDGYAQKDEHMREMEKEAYEAAIILRDFEDSIDKADKHQITLDEWKNRELFSSLLERFLPKKEDSKITEILEKEQPCNLSQRVSNILSKRMKNNR